MKIGPDKDRPIRDDCAHCMHDNFRDDCESPHAPINLRVNKSAGTRMQHPVPFLENSRNWINPCTADKEQSCLVRVRMKAPKGISPDKLSGFRGRVTGLPQLRCGPTNPAKLEPA